jgi:hypothetical protein
MSRIAEMMSQKSKSISSVQPSKTIVKAIPRSSIVTLNKSIDSKIRQNEQERTASMNAAARCIVGGKL